jgi:ABC-type transport system substrate-binding protein
MVRRQQSPRKASLIGVPENAIAQQFITIGIDASVLSMNKEQYWGRVVPKGEYEIVFGWLSCGSIAEPYTSMARYVVEPQELMPTAMALARDFSDADQRVVTIRRRTKPV